MKKDVHFMRTEPRLTTRILSTYPWGFFFCLSIYGSLGCQWIPDPFKTDTPNPSTLQRSTCNLPTLEHNVWWEGEWMMVSSAFENQIFNTLSAFEHPTQTPKKDLLAIPTLPINQTPTQQFQRLSNELARSLSEQFLLRVEPQFAYLQIDSHDYRLATSPLESQNGVKLLGSQISAFLWCEGSKIMFSFKIKKHF